jgi:Fe-S cluster biogenesis protein NfuA
MKKSILEKKVEKVLEKIRPYINLHGGDVQLEGIEGRTVTLKISGACVGCALADFTYNETVGNLIKEKVPEIKKIIII